MKDDVLKTENTKILMPFDFEKYVEQQSDIYETEKRHIETICMKNDFSMIRNQSVTYKTIDIKKHGRWLFRGQKAGYKNKRLKYTKSFIFGDQINEIKDKHFTGYIMNDLKHEWRLYGVRQKTLGIRAPIDGYRAKIKKNKKKYIKIMMFEGDIVKRHSKNSERNGLTGIIEIVDNIFAVFDKNDLGYPLINLEPNEFWEVIGNTAEINVPIQEIRVNDK